MRNYLVIKHRFIRSMGVGYLPREVTRFSASWPVIGRAKRFMRGRL